VCLNGLSYEQASVQLGIPVGTIRSRLFRARGALMGLLEPYPRTPTLAALSAAGSRPLPRLRH
jgi:RNA polymerase sigma-70 factor (ECF subfamily)